MGMWIYLTLISLLVPGILAAIGSIFRNSAPADINPIYGYRSTMSMKNQDTWEFANTYWGKLAWKWGLTLIPASAAIMVAVIWAGVEVVSITLGVVEMLQILVLLGTIPAVERALKREFDQDGNRRTDENRNS